MIPLPLIEQLRKIEIQTLRATSHPTAGERRSLIRGRGFDFEQHRPYQTGDDYRQIDWNVTARMQQPYIKKSREEKEMTAVILVDLSRSMDFATARQSKRELLLVVAATLAFSALHDHMKVGLLGFTDRIEMELPPQRGPARAWRILDALWEIRPQSRGTSFIPALEHLDRTLKRASLLFCISDFITQEELFTSNSLRHLARKHDFVPLIIDDRLEEALPESRGFLRLRDTEGGGEMLLHLSPGPRRQYETLMRERREALRRSLYQLGLDHLFLRAGESYLDPIMAFFLARKRRR